MMRSLAQFIMRGRLQAAVLAMLSVLVPLLPQGAVGLVSLRKGAREGAIVVVAGTAPLIIAWSLGRSNDVLFWGTLLGLLAAYVPAIALRATVSWSFSLQAAVAMCAVSSVLLLLLIPALISGFAEILLQLLAVTAVPPAVDMLPDVSSLDFAQISGFIAVLMLLNGLTGLLLARWWQALLYNPGGFGEEFQQLRLGIWPSVVLMALVVLSYLQGAEYSFWASVFATPLALVAIAIAHAMVKFHSSSQVWLVALYMLMIFFSPLLVVLVIIGFIDSWLNIRSRFSR